MAATFPEAPKIPVENDTWYDPCNPKYVVQVSAQEVASLHAALLRRQIRGLQSVLRSRQDAFRQGSKDAEVLRHYEIVLANLITEFKSLFLDDDVLAQSPVLSERFAKAESPARRSETSISTCSGETSRSMESTCSLDSTFDSDDVDVDGFSSTWELVNNGQQGTKCNTDRRDSRPFASFDIHLGKGEGHEKEFDGNGWLKQCFETAYLTIDDSWDLSSARHSIITEEDVDNLSPIWQLLEDEEDYERKDHVKRWSARRANPRPVESITVDIDDAFLIWQPLQGNNWDEAQVAPSDGECSRLIISI